MPDKKKQTLGQAINYPGSNPEPEKKPAAEGPGLWDTIKQAMFPAKPDKASAQTNAPSGGGAPNLDPEKVRQFQKGLFGK